MADSFNITPSTFNDDVSTRRLINQMISTINTLRDTLDNVKQENKDNASKLSDLEGRITKLENN